MVLQIALKTSLEIAHSKASSIHKAMHDWCVCTGPSLMPGGTQEAYKYIEEIVKKVAAQVDDGPCVTYIGEGGAGNFVKMVHNGIEYGDMQLISEAYDVLKTVGGLTNPELEQAFNDWNKVRLAQTLPGCKSSGTMP